MISLIVPIYNAADYLPKCLTSLTHQSFNDIEIILINDGSTDRSLDIAQQFAQTDQRIHIITQSNQGQGAARNAGLAIAQGEYVVFVDADDYLDEHFVEQHARAISGYDMVQSGYRRVKSGEILEEKTPWHNWQFTSACMRLYRREAIEGIRFEEGIRYEDVLWTVDVLLRKPRVKIIKYIGYNYRLTPHSTTSYPHEADRKRVLNLLKKKQQAGITRYTQIKLKLYWLLGK